MRVPFQRRHPAEGGNLPRAGHGLHDQVPVQHHGQRPPQARPAGQGPVLHIQPEIADGELRKHHQLIRKILLASASIPGAFPPVYFDVEASGKHFDEMHVDGGTASQVFFFPISVDWTDIIEKLEVEGTPRVYVIRNSRLESDWEVVKPTIYSIAGRSIGSLIRTQGIGDMYRIYLGAQRDGIDFNLTYIPEDFTIEPEEPFDPTYMRKLFDIGYERGKSEFFWKKTPPDFEED